MVDRIKYAELLDELYDLNAILEICRGYTQADSPDMGALDNALHRLHGKYEQLYGEFTTLRA